MKTKDIVATYARLVAFFAGFPPTEVWRTYAQFETDLHNLIDLIGELEDEAKPILEERERQKTR